MTNQQLEGSFKETVYQMKTAMNPHYNCESSENQTCIDAVNAYDTAFKTGDITYLAQAEKDALGGQDGYQTGVKVQSPWGENAVLEANITKNADNKTPENADDIVKKEITVKPGFMLSLQRHRGRQELWEVESGTLTVISDGQVYDIPAGESISLPKGNVHCMINRHETPVTVIETQTGFCREADNVRLVDFNNRPTYPLLTKVEAQSAILYAQIHQEIEQKFGAENAPQEKFLSPDYEKVVNNLFP